MPLCLLLLQLYKKYADTPSTYDVFIAQIINYIIREFLEQEVRKRQTKAFFVLGEGMCSVMQLYEDSARTWNAKGK